MDPLSSIIEDLRGLNLTSDEGQRQAYNTIRSHVNNSVQSRINNSYKAPKPQLFSGGRDALVTRDWLEQLERYCKRTNFPEDEWSSAAIDHLRGTALTWFRTSKLSENTPWASFKSAFTKEFRPSDHERHILMELRDLKQRDVKEIGTYINRFRDLALQLDDPIDHMLREYFVAGLMLHTQVQVEIANPKSWQEAIQVAERINDIYARAVSKTKTTFLLPQPAQNNHELPKAEPMDVDNLKTLLAHFTALASPTTELSNIHRPLGKLMPKEREYLRRIGACFKCRKPGHLAANCRMGRSFNNFEITTEGGDKENDQNSGKDKGEA